MQAKLDSYQVDEVFSVDRNRLSISFLARLQSNTLLAIQVYFLII